MTASTTAKQTPQPRLAIVGAGLRPGSMTQEACEQLERCGRVLLVGLQNELAAHLKKELPKAELLGYERGSWRAWQREAVHRVVSAARESASVGAVLSGHPLAFSLGPRICRLAARLRLPYRVLPGLDHCAELLSLVEPLLRRAARWSLSGPTLFCAAEEIVCGRVTPRRELSLGVIGLSACGLGREPEAAKPLASALGKAYGPDWRCFLVDVGARRETGVEDFPIEELPRHWSRLDDESALFVPLRPSGRRGG